MNWMTAEYFWPYKAGRYPVRIYYDSRCSPTCQYVAAPVAIGGHFDGCLTQGATPEEAVERLRAILPSAIRFWRRECGMTPRPAPTPTLMLESVRPAAGPEGGK